MSLAATTGRTLRPRVSLLSRHLQFATAALAAVAAISANPLLSLAGIGMLAWIWMGAIDSPPQTILAAYLSFQWLQVTMKIWLADVLGVSLGAAQIATFGPQALIFAVPEETQSAVLLGLGCIGALSFGFRFTAPRIADFHPHADKLDARKLMALYIGLWVVSGVTGPFVGGGLAQPLNVIGWLRFVPVVLLFVRWLTVPGSYSFLAVSAMEIGTGFLGFFSGFRNIFFILGPFALASFRILRRRAFVMLFSALIAVVVLGSFWMSIKDAYRSALDLGSGSQAVSLPLADRLRFLAQAAANTNPAQLVVGVEAMALRISYTDYLADVLRDVPAMIAYQDGRLWGKAFKNVLMPRLFFPNKPALPSDSERTMRYTGLALASGRQGTSISMGYVADSYVDFGVAGAIMVAASIGALYGLIVRHLTSLNSERDSTVVVAIMAILFFPAQEFEISSVKLLGGILWNWIVCAAFIRYGWPTLRRVCAQS
jgi:hypothetical protein